MAHGAATDALLTQLTVIRTLFAQTIAASGAAYAATDALNEAAFGLPGLTDEQAVQVTEALRIVRIASGDV